MSINHKGVFKLQCVGSSADQSHLVTFPRRCMPDYGVSYWVGSVARRRVGIGYSIGSMKYKLAIKGTLGNIYQLINVFHTVSDD